MANVDFEGQTFELKTGPMNELVMTEFYAATVDKDTGSEVAPGVMLALLEECITDKDFGRFRKLGRKVDGFWEKVTVVLEARMKVAGEHPTGLASDSTDGPENTPPNSESLSDAKILQLANGRIDKYAMLKEAQAAQRSA